MSSELDNVIALTYGASLNRGGWEATLCIAADGDVLDNWQRVEIWQRDIWNGFHEGWWRVMEGYAIMPQEIKRDA